MTLKLPQIIGHRGVAAYAPENTLVGIHTAADMGVEWVEVDVKLTKDQVPILFHDEVLERSSNGSGLVKDHTLAELKELDAGSWFSESFYGIGIPTLEEAVEVLIERDLGLNLEIKPCEGREVETAEAALDVLSGIWDDHERIYISSYHIECLECSHDMMEAWARGIVMGYHCPDPQWIRSLENGVLPENWHEVAEHLKLSAVSIDNEFTNPDTVQAMLDRNIHPIPYNVNDGERARVLQGLGVKTVISDRPDEARDGILSVH